MDTIAEILKDHPQIQKAYIAEQKLAGNPPNLNISMYSSIAEKGFSWSQTIDKYGFWATILETRDFDRFYKKYPKTASTSTIEVTDFLNELAVDRLTIE